jgi:hypothetical protein
LHEKEYQWFSTATAGSPVSAALTCGFPNAVDPVTELNVPLIALKSFPLLGNISKASLYLFNKIPSLTNE